MNRKFENLVKGKRFLVTGGTGSFGKYIASALLQGGAKEIVIFSRDEDKQYSMEFEYRDNSDRLRFVIGDVRDVNSLIKATRGIDIVFHAAALKQIPSTENNVIEAIRTNSIGAQNVVDAALENNVGKVIGISTDKAVEPINSMGMTKALQEKIFILGNKYRDNRKTKFSLVRYGNVIGSRGSVIPVFKKQLENGQKLKVTHEEMTRFIITLSQAKHLVATALYLMKGGEIFIPKIRSLKIIDLAEVLLQRNKQSTGKVTITGVRPGEKLHETLISPPESLHTIEEKDYFIVLPQIQFGEYGFSYRTQQRKTTDMYRYSSDTGPFLSKKEIGLLLDRENL